MSFWRVLLMFSLAACATPSGPAGTRATPEVRVLPNGMMVERRIGTLEYFASPVLIDAPESVARGEQFVIAVTTYGSDCIGKGDMEVQIDGLAAIVTPYDWEVTRLPPNTGCRVAIQYNEHTASLGFDQAGTARIVVRGRRKPSGEVITVERRIEVR